MLTAPCHSEQCAGVTRPHRVVGVQRGIVLTVLACTTCDTHHTRRDVAGSPELARVTAERDQAQAELDALQERIRALVGPT